MECCCCCCCCVAALVAFFIIYKLLDMLIRRFPEGRKTSRYILITGCDTGFGQELAKRLDARGCQVFAGCLTRRGQDELTRVCSVQLVPVYLDVTKPETVRKAYTFIKGHLPDRQGLWGVVNNAGILGRCGPEEWIRIEDYKEVLEVNLYGLIDVTMTFLPLVKMTPRGRIVNTAGVFGRHVIGECAPYCVSKYGVEAFTDGLRRSLRQYGTQVVLIEPGYHRTPITAKTHIAQQFERAWKDLPPETKTEFGDDYFRKGLQRIDKLDRFVSPRVSDVVDAIEHSLLWYFPRARYVVGKDARFLWLPIQALPEWLGDWILQRLMNPVPSIPTGVQSRS